LGADQVIEGRLRLKLDGAARAPQVERRAAVGQEPVHDCDPAGPDPICESKQVGDEEQ
jgi:hypothetical protein